MSPSSRTRRPCWPVSSCQYRDPHDKNKTILSYLVGIFIPGKPVFILKQAPGLPYVIRGLCHQKQVSQAGISNCIPQHTVGCNYLSLPEIHASGDKVLICPCAVNVAACHLFPESGVNTYDEEAINAALHRLTLRQQQRQYTAGKTAALLDTNKPRDSLRHRTHSWSGTEGTSSKHSDGHHSRAGSESTHDSSEKSRPVSRGRPSTSHSNRGRSQSLRTTEDTYNNLMDEAEFDNEAAYSRVTGVRPRSGSYRPSRGSQQFQVAQRQEQESRAQLEQSKAKHQQQVNTWGTPATFFSLKTVFSWYRESIMR